MLNLNNPHGFMLVGRGSNGGQCVLEEVTKAASLAQAWFRGDRLFPASDGTVTRTNTPGTTPLLGISNAYSPASTAAALRVITSPDALFEAQSDNDATGLVLTNTHNNCNAIDGAGSAYSLISGDMLDTSSAATAAALDFKLIGLLPDPQNEFGNFARFICIPNLHIRNTRAAGV